MAKDIAQQIQSWLPPTIPWLIPRANRGFWNLRQNSQNQSRPRGHYSAPPGPRRTSSTPGMTPIHQALQGRPTTTSTFEPSPLLVVPGTVSTWPEENQPASLTDSSDSNYYKYIMARRLQTIPQPKMDALDKNFQKALQCWQNQPDAASKTIHRVSLAMGLELHKLKKSTTDELVIKVMTAALTLSSLLASYLRSSCFIAKQI